LINNNDLTPGLGGYFEAGKNLGIIDGVKVSAKCLTAKKTSCS
jgi:hypothetical protein